MIWYHCFKHNSSLISINTKNAKNMFNVLHLVNKFSFWACFMHSKCIWIWKMKVITFLCIKIICGFNHWTLWTMLFINGIFHQCIGFYFCNGCKYLGHVCLKGIWKSALIPPIWCHCQIWLGLWSLLLTWLSNLFDYWNEWRISFLFAHYENHITIIQMLSFVNLHGSISLSHDVGEVGYVGVNKN